MHIFYQSQKSLKKIEQISPMLLTRKLCASTKKQIFVMKKGRFQPLKAFRVGMLTLRTRLWCSCGACGRPVGPVV
jgi:hypothetical protein